MKRIIWVVLLAVVLSGAAISLFACSERATLPLDAGIGPAPQLPPQNHTLFPTVNIAPAMDGRARRGRRQRLGSPSLPSQAALRIHAMFMSCQTAMCW